MAVGSNSPCFFSVSSGAAGWGELRLLVAGIIASGVGSWWCHMPSSASTLGTTSYRRSSLRNFKKNTAARGSLDSTSLRSLEVACLVPNCISFLHPWQARTVHNLCWWHQLSTSRSKYQHSPVYLVAALLVDRKWPQALPVLPVLWNVFMFFRKKINSTKFYEETFTTL